jgi:hypothetical protein
VAIAYNKIIPIVPTDEHGRKNIHLTKSYFSNVTWEIEYTDEFKQWWDVLSETKQDDIISVVQLLEEKGANLPFPYSSGVNDSKHSHLRELRIQSGGNPLRIFYAFDPRRTAILLIGGDKTGDNRFYEKYIPLADRLYDQYLEELRQEGLL